MQCREYQNYHKIVNELMKKDLVIHKFCPFISPFYITYSNSVKLRTEYILMINSFNGAIIINTCQMT